MVAIARYATIGIPVAAVVILLHAMWTFTPRVPFEDEWENLPLVHHFLTGTFSLGEAWAYHNQHRIFVPRLVDLAIILVTHWNRQVEMTVDLAFAAASTVLFFLALRKTLRSAFATWALLVPLSLLVLSVGEFENWLEPFQITFVLTITGIACCVFGLAIGKGSNAGFLLALIGAVLAALSSLGGTLAFIAFFPTVIVLGRKQTALWVAVALGVLIPYFIGFPRSQMTFQVVAIAEYGLAYLGAPLANWNLRLSIAAGLVSLIAASASVVIYWRQRPTLLPMGPWIGLGLFGLGVAGMTALGRDASGELIYALSSRYQAFSGVWWIAVLALASICIASMHDASEAPHTMSSIPPSAITFPAVLTQGFVVALFMVTTMLIVQNNLGSLPRLYLFQRAQKQHEQCIQHYIQSPPDCFLHYYPSPGTIQVYSAVLQEDHMGSFYSSQNSVQFAGSLSAPALNLYTDKVTHKYWTAIDLNLKQWDAGLVPQYQFVRRLGYLLPYPQHENDVTMYPLFGCYANEVEFLSLDFTCDGKSKIQVEGWLYSVAPAGRATSPLYQCPTNSGYISSNSADCGTGQKGTLLGYVLK